jgi:putative FmdB family regulatory protein
MPRYDYKCNACEYVFEVQHRMAEDGPKKCPRCEKERPEKMISCPNITYANRPPWTYKEAKKYKTARMNGGPLVKIDPNKHGDLASWNSPGEVVPEKKRARGKKTK